MLRAYACAGRVAALVFLALLMSWSACVVQTGESALRTAMMCAIGMVFSNAASAMASVAMTMRGRRLLAEHACLGCGYAMAGGDGANRAMPTPSAICTECGRAADDPAMSPALCEAIPQLRKGFGRLEMPLGVLVIVVSLAGAAIVVLPLSAISHERASPLGLGIFAIGMGIALVGSTLRNTLAAHSSPRAQ